MQIARNANPNAIYVYQCSQMYFPNSITIKQSLAVFGVHADDFSLSPCIQDHGGKLVAIYTAAVKALTPSLEIQTARAVVSVDHDGGFRMLDQ